MSKYVLVDHVKIQQNKQFIEAVKAMAASEPNVSNKLVELINDLKPVVTLEDELNQAQNALNDENNPNRLFANRRYAPVRKDAFDVAPLFGGKKG